MSPAPNPRSQTVRPAPAARNAIVAVVGGNIEVAVESFNGQPQIHLRDRRSSRFLSFPISVAADIVHAINKGIDVVVANARGEVSP